MRDRHEKPITPLGSAATLSESSLLNLTVDQIRTFLEVCRSGSATRASQNLRRQRTSVQKQLKAIEGYVGEVSGAPLFAPRRKKGDQFVLTSAGQIFKSHAEHMIEQLDMTRHDLQQGTYSVNVGLSNF